MRVQIKDGQLFVDATDRSMKFYLTFEHIRDQKVFVADLVDSEDDQDHDYFKAEFVIVDERQEKDGVLQASRMGLHIESDLQELIWFDRIKDL